MIPAEVFPGRGDSIKKDALFLKRRLDNDKVIIQITDAIVG
jgi:hypothetical protein